MSSWNKLLYIFMDIYCQCQQYSIVYKTKLLKTLNPKKAFDCVNEMHQLSNMKKLLDFNFFHTEVSIWRPGSVTYLSSVWMSLRSSMPVNGAASFSSIFEKLFVPCQTVFWFQKLKMPFIIFLANRNSVWPLTSFKLLSYRCKTLAAYCSQHTYKQHLKMRKPGLNEKKCWSLEIVDACGSLFIPVRFTDSSAISGK